MFPSRQIETRGSCGCPFLRNRGLNRLCWGLGGPWSRSRDRLWLRRRNPWWCSWLGRGGATGAGGVLELRQPLQPNLSKPGEYPPRDSGWTVLPGQRRLGGLDPAGSDSDRSSWWSSRLSVRGLGVRDSRAPASRRIGGRVAAPDAASSSRSVLSCSSPQPRRPPC